MNQSPLMSNESQMQSNVNKVRAMQGNGQTIQ